MKQFFSKYAAKFLIRKITLILADAFIVISAALITDFILSFSDNSISNSEMIIPIVISTVCCFAFLFIFGAYSKMWRYSKPKDYCSCIAGSIMGISSTWLFNMICTGDSVKLPYFVLHMLLTTVGVSMFRLLFRSAFIDISDKKKNSENNMRTMIIGGGQACKMLLKEIRNSQNSACCDGKTTSCYDPVCIIDDDRNKIGSSIEDVEIVGSTYDIPKFINEKDIELIIFAIPSCLEDERKRILNICSETGKPVKKLPFIGNLIFDENKPTLLNQVHDINVEDLLGRDPIKFDSREISNFIGGKVCMVTGGGGSIGSELVRQIAKYSPKKIIIVDIYENNAYDIQQELTMEYGDSLDLVTLIASVRDYYRMNQIFAKHKPQVVFHAAAHKHVPLMEASPMEAIKNNIIGTFNTATLAQFHKIEKFVMISTDKAVNPTNVMGASKRCCEMIVQYLAQQNEGCTEFVTTRFGNVLGSNGSVIPLFKRQIEQGKPVTVTHRDIIRYFMTIPEAVSLVMEAAAIAEGGEIFVLDMGKPVRIITLAENLIRMYGKVPYVDVPIEFTGLRPGEKIKEELLMDEEGLQKTSNKLIFIGKQIEIDESTFAQRLRELRDAAEKNDERLAINALHKMVPTFITPEEFNNKLINNKSHQKDASEISA